MGIYASTALADAKKEEVFKSIDDAFAVQKYGTADKLLSTITPEEAIVRLTSHASTGDIPAMWMLAKQYNRMGEGYRQDMANWTYSAVLGTRAYLNTCSDKEQIKAAEYKIIKTYSDEVHGARLYQDIRDKAIDYAIDFYTKCGYVECYAKLMESTLKQKTSIIYSWMKWKDLKIRPRILKKTNNSKAKVDFAFFFVL